jgi:polar amino acid transport system ATP-binding protein
MSAIAVESLKKTFAGRAVLQALTFSADPGHVTAIIGASGCGKSTLLRCIVGLEAFDDGVVRVGDVALVAKDGSDRERALAAVRRRVGLVFQGLHLFPHRTAIENVSEAPIFVRGDAPDAARKRARELLDLVGLSHRENAYPAQLSGGEQQRVAIARALAMDPEVLLLDEPTSALDPGRRRELGVILRRLAERSITVIVVTHEMGFARDSSDRTVVVCDGAVIEQGATSDLFSSPRDPRTKALIES